MLALILGIATAGQVHNEDVSLGQVAGWSLAAVVVQLETPASRSVEIPVPRAGLKGCGTYAYGVHRVTVVEVLQPPPKPLSLVPDQAINVFLANTGSLVDLTHRACAQGGSKSPIFERFEGDPPADGERRLVLLSYEEPYGWREAVAGSWLLETRRDELTKALEGQPVRSAPAVSGDLLCVVDADCTDGRRCGDAMRCRK